MQVKYNMVSCFIIRPDEGGKGYEFLQIRRSKGDFMGGTWQTVYGTTEEGETAWQAALRELKEETGLVPMEFYLLEGVSVFYIVPTDTMWHCVQFCAIVKRGDTVKLNEEHDASRWIAADRASSEFMWLEDRKMAERVMSEIVGNGPQKAFVRIVPPNASTGG